MWWYNSLDVFEYKIDICHISCAIALLPFRTLVLELEVHCSFVYICFYTKIFRKCNFRTHYNDCSLTILIESESSETTPEL